MSDDSGSVPPFDAASVFDRALAVRADLTWERVRAMPADVAAELAALEMSRHARHRLVRRLWLLILPVPIAVAFITDHSLAALGSGIAAGLAVRFAPKALWVRQYGMARALIASHTAPTGRLHVLCMALLGSRLGTIGWAQFHQALAHGPDELSCDVLGRHTDGFCPHRRNQPA